MVPNKSWEICVTNKDSYTFLHIAAKRIMHVLFSSSYIWRHSFSGIGGVGQIRQCPIAHSPQLHSAMSVHAASLKSIEVMAGLPLCSHNGHDRITYWQNGTFYLFTAKLLRSKEMQNLLSEYLTY